MLISPLSWGVQHSVSFPAAGGVGTSATAANATRSAREDSESRRRRFECASSRKEFLDGLQNLVNAGLWPRYVRAPETTLSALRWERMQAGLDPTAGGLAGARAQHKRWQVENLAGLVASLIRPGATIVEFCAGSGFIALPLAAMFPSCNFVLVDMKRRSLDIAIKRMRSAGLGNVSVVHGRVEEFNQPFDLGIALHACGEASDLTMECCITKRAAFVICPCCVGKIKHSSLLSYPRSRKVRDALSNREYASVARAADNSVRDLTSATRMEQKRRLCKSFVELDRNLHAEDSGYDTFMFVLQPHISSPKNDVLVGFPRRADGEDPSRNARINILAADEWQPWNPGEWLSM